MRVAGLDSEKTASAMMGWRFLCFAPSIQRLYRGQPSHHSVWLPISIFQDKTHAILRNSANALRLGFILTPQHHDGRINYLRTSIV